MRPRSDLVSERFSTLSVASDDALITVRLNRPHARNAVNLQMCGELISLFHALHDEGSARLVVIRGAGPTFCAGVDIREMAAQDVEWVRRRRSAGLDAYLAIERCPLPVICVVHGAVIGAGCEIAAACDFVIAEEGACFQWPEALRGVVGATQRLARIVGRPMAKELLFTARRISAEQAQAIGFINHITCRGGLDEALALRTQEILACKPLALSLMKRALNLGETLDRATAADLERALIEQSLSSDEWRHGIADFAPNSPSEDDRGERPIVERR